MGQREQWGVPRHGRPCGCCPLLLPRAGVPDGPRSPRRLWDRATLLSLFWSVHWDMDDPPSWASLDPPHRVLEWGCDLVTTLSSTPGGLGRRPSGCRPRSGHFLCSTPVSEDGGGLSVLSEWPWRRGFGPRPKLGREAAWKVGRCSDPERAGVWGGVGSPSMEAGGGGGDRGAGGARGGELSIFLRATARPPAVPPPRPWRRCGGQRREDLVPASRVVPLRQAH